MNRIGKTKQLKRLTLQPQKILPTVIYSTTNPTILPPYMVHAGQSIELPANLVGSPSFLRQGLVFCHAGTSHHELRFQRAQSRGDFLVHLAANSGKPKEDRVTVQSNQGIDIVSAAEDSVSAEGIECLARVSEDEEYEYDVSDPVCICWSISFSFTQTIGKTGY